MARNKIGDIIHVDGNSYMVTRHGPEGSCGDCALNSTFNCLNGGVVNGHGCEKEIGPDTYLVEVDPVEELIINIKEAEDAEVHE